MLTFKSFAQISIDNFPQNLQLYPRDAANKATVNITGKVTDTSYEKVILNVTKNGNAYQNQENSLNFGANNGQFVFNIEINAELSEYTFKLFLSKNGSQTLVKQADRVVCGDAILLYGQSNMVAIPGIDDFNANISDQFIRNYDFPSIGNTNPAELQWFPSKNPYARVGTIGNQLQKMLIDKYRIPTCVINASEGGFSITALADRNPNDHASADKPYGRMLLRAKKAGLLGAVRYLAYRQGENEAGSYYLFCNQYPNNFDLLYKEIIEDFPALQKMYVLQNNILNEGYVERAGFLRDFQRRVKQLYPKIETLATVGTNDYIPPHYGANGYKQTAFELFRLIDRDFYGSNDVNQINSPDIKSVLINDTKNILTLVFDDNQQMIYPKDSIVNGKTWSMKDFFFMNSDNQKIDFNEDNHPVESGWADGNKIYLKLKAPTNDIYLTYLPSTYSDGFYSGTHLKNARGMRAFSFYEVQISGTNAPVPVPTPSPCEAIIVSTDITKGEFTFEGLTIEATNKVGSKTKAKFTAMQIDLKPGFDAVAGSDFDAITGGCGAKK